MKYWKYEIEENLTFEEAKTCLKENKFTYITRPEWNGVHYLDDNGKWCILEANSEVINDTDDICDTDKNDWCVVEVNKEALDIIKKKSNKTIFEVRNFKFKLGERLVIDNTTFTCNIERDKVKVSWYDNEECNKKSVYYAIKNVYENINNGIWEIVFE